MAAGKVPKKGDNATGKSQKKAKKAKGKFYITTAIDYPNSKPHLGHAYEKTVSDCLARWHRLKGEEVFFLTGTDEHGKKIQQAAEKAGLEPKAFVDGQVLGFKELCEKWNISNDRFIRTTEPSHEKTCQEIFDRVLKKGDIYLGKYEGLYCTACEAFYLEKDLVGGLCPTHMKPVEPLSEESYFFRMSKYQGRLLDYFEKNPEFIFPLRRRQEIINRVREGLKDLSVSRTSFAWGIPLKNNSMHVIYVWFDALLNYISGVDYPSKQFGKFWPADMHVVGKDILWFHSVIWPTMLFSAGIEPPRMIFVHGFINTASGEKLSKTAGNQISPVELSGKYGADTVRYYLLREIPLGEDGNFSIESLVERHNQELANGLGNLVNRALSLAEKKLGGKVPDAKTDGCLADKLDMKKIGSFMDALETHNALSEIFSFVSACNKYVNDKEPWKLEGKECEKVLYSVLDSVRVIAVLLQPFVPGTAERIASQLNVKLGGIECAEFNLLEAGKKFGKKEILFAKIDLDTSAK
ncbi:Methionine--tRNA ligase [uncultured archaeon]|nr:Methionine--tRNA ligase [uncultured archaeon]